MLRRLSLRDVVIVPELEVEFGAGFTALTGETGAGKSILIDALQLALGTRADPVVVREGAARAEVAAEFDQPAAAAAWLREAGFDAEAADPAPVQAHTDQGRPGEVPPPALLLRRTVDAQGRSRAWINGSPATVTQLRELAEWLVDIHGQHAWQGLTRPATVRALIDGVAGTDTRTVAEAHARRKAAADALARARDRIDEIERERERLAWQVAELDRLAPAEDEWAGLSAEHQRLAHGQSLVEAAHQAMALVAGDDDTNAEALALRAAEALAEVVQHDEQLAPVIEALNGAVAQLQDAAHTLSGYLRQTEPDPGRLAELDARLSAWMGLARRWRRPPEELPALWRQWRDELKALDAATDLDALQAAFNTADGDYRKAADALGRARRKAAEPLARSVTEAMQTLGMDGGRFAVHIETADEPQAHGMDDVELRVAGHAGATPRALAKVASGGELSRLALAIAVCTTASEGGNGAGTLIFDEIDAGIGGAVGDTVGALMRRLGQRHQVLAVTHLAQVAACADHHLVVSKQVQDDGRTTSRVQPVVDAARTHEVARMLGGVQMSDTRLAHAQAMLTAGGNVPQDAPQDAPQAATQDKAMTATHAAPKGKRNTRIEPPPGERGQTARARSTAPKAAPKSAPKAAAKSASKASSRTTSPSGRPATGHTARPSRGKATDGAAD